MAMATLPSYAGILRDGYSETPDFGVVRSEMDSGLAKQRSRFSTPIRNRVVQLTIKTNKTAFETWVANSINGGSGWFTMVDPVDGVTKTVRFVAGKLEYTQLNAVEWLVKCQIEGLG